MCQFFKKRGFPDSAGCQHRTGKHRAQKIDRETALETSQGEEMNIVPFSYTKPSSQNIILKNFKILRNDPENKVIFPLPPLVSFKRDKNIGNFLARSEFF